MERRFKYEIAPNKEQKIFLNKTLGSTRFVYNQALEKSIKEYQLYKENPDLPKPNVSSFGLAYLAKSLKEEFDFLKSVSSMSLQQSLIDLGKAYKGFFNGNGYPKFKSKKQNRDSFRLVGDGFKIRNKNLHIVTLKSPIKVYWCRELPVVPSSLTITRTPTGRYFVSFVCKYTPYRKSGEDILGIDVGLKHYATTSKGEHIANPKFLNKSLKKLARVQKKHSRKQIGSNNRNKSRIKVAKLYERITNQRKDFQHKLSTRLVNDNQVLTMESLNVKGMIKNRRLAKSISDVSWGEFFKMLRYKSEESSDGRIVMASPFFPSTQLCSHCNQKTDKKVKQEDHFHYCTYCKSRTDRDLNAAMNLRTMAIVLFKHYPEYGNINPLMAPDYKDFLMFEEYQ